MAKFKELCPECGEAMLEKDQDGKIFCDECCNEFVLTDGELVLKTDK